jgi:uncharacterized membrane protein
MVPRIRRQWDRIRSSFWFLPSLLVGGVVALAFASLALDEVKSAEWAKGWIYSGSPEGASTILGTIAGSMITTVGVIFSITLVALTLASNQFGPRLLRNFRRDTTTQIVMGFFISTFLYSLLVLRAIRRENAGDFVPHVSVSLAVLLALASLGMLIYFIHHIAVSIQANEVIGRVWAELTRNIDRVFPDKIGEADPHSGPEARLPESFDREAVPVAAHSDGYLQLIDPEGLLRLAVQEDALLQVEQRPGRYIVAGVPLVRVWPPARVTKRFEARVRQAFVLGRSRTPLQDVEFSVNQLVEVAVRALSPSINDPFTANTCVDRLGSALCRLALREIPSPYRRDSEGKLRVVAPPFTFAGMADAAWNQIRQAARTNASVTIRLLESIANVAEVARRPEDRATLRRHAEMIARGAHEGLPEDEDRRAVRERYRRVKLRLDGFPP